MYLHIGQDTVVRTDDILGIFDIETASVSSDTKEFLTAAQQGGRVVNVTKDLPKSFILCMPEGEKDMSASKLYISQISTTTLYKRADIEEGRGILG
jgi:hypothetical protein